MSLTLYFHPLSSFCHKVLTALYENDTPFQPHIVDLIDPKAHADFIRMWPIGKFPVLRDTARDLLIPESNIIIEYLARYYPGPTALVPADPERAWQVRARDRFFDLYVNEPMQKIVTDKLRPEGQNDLTGVAQAKERLAIACNMIERDMAAQTWAAGDEFSMADCAAAPALFYADKVIPFAGTRPNAARYLERLRARPSYARVLTEAQPYFNLFPG